MFGDGPLKHWASHRPSLDVLQQLNRIHHGKGTFNLGIAQARGPHDVLEEFAQDQAQR